MAKAPTMGRRAGTLHVRVIPDTRNFNKRLLGQLKRLEKQLPAMKVQVNDAHIQKAHVRRALQRQLSEIRNLKINVDVDAELRNVTRDLDQLRQANQKFDLIPELDRVMLERVAKETQAALKRIEPTITPNVDDDMVRAQVNGLVRELKKLERDLKISVISPEHAAEIRHRINEIGDELDEMAKNRTVRVDINPFTSWASARLAWLTRPRVVEIIPKVSQAALAKAATMLAALSGARLSFDYMQRFSDWVSEVDKKLPGLTFGTLGLTSAFSALMGSISGLVGLGDGLAALVPSLLLVPGLLAGAAMSGVTLFVALKDSKERLEELGDSYTNLGKIIKDSFWGEAKQPIVDFSNSIMPQLERSFEKTSLAIGRFTKQFARDLQREFANGRLEAMFDGLAASWDELSRGTAAFAGAITNLGLVAARYMPRLAKWFVRQADTFDNWLSQVATDGRLNKWMEEAIDSFYALWDVTAATTGIFQGLWKAAEAAGAGGLRGFADMLLDWEKAVQGAKWQSTLTSMFRGAGEALDGIGEGFERFGEMLYTQQSAIEYFMGTAGQSLGDFFGEISDSLSRPEVADGMTKFIDGIAGGLEKLAPALDPMAVAFGDIIGGIGDLANAIGEPLSTAFTTASEIISGLVGDLEEHDVFDRLAEAFDDTLAEVSPTLKELAGAIGDELVPALVDFAENALPVISDLLTLLGPVGVEAIGNAADTIGSLADSFELLEAAGAWFFGGDKDAAAGTVEDLDAVSGALDSLLQFLLPVVNVLDTFGISIESMTSLMREAITGAVEKFGELKESVSSFADDASAGLDIVVDAFTNFPENVNATLSGLAELLVPKGVELVGGLQRGADVGFLAVENFLAGISTRVLSYFGSVNTWLQGPGTQMLDALRIGATIGFQRVTAFLQGIPGQIISFFSGAGSWLLESGRSVLSGFAQGIMEGLASAKATVSSALSEIRGAFPFSPAKWGPFSGRGWVTYSGATVGDAFGDSIASALDRSRLKVAKSMVGIRGEFTSLTSDVNSLTPRFDVSGQFSQSRVHASQIGAGAQYTSGPGSTGQTMNVTANFVQPEERERLREFTAVLERVSR